MTLGEKIKKIRNDKFMSQRELGRRIHKRHTGVSKMERGVQTITATDIMYICKALEITVLDLFDVPTEALVRELEKREDFMGESYGG